MINQRRLFADTLHQEMKTNPKIRLIVGDLGYKIFDECFADYPDRCFNSGAAEVLMTNMAVGMSLSGFRPVIYSITPFLLWRPAEQIRLYINHESIPVVLVGSGRDSDYGHDGFSHDACDDKDLMRVWKNITPYWPNGDDEVIKATKDSLNSNKPSYINLTR